MKSENTKPNTSSSHANAHHKSTLSSSSAHHLKSAATNSELLKSSTPFPMTEVAEGTSIPLPDHLVDPSAREAAKLAGYIGAYSPEQRKLRIEKFLEKRNRRVWTRKVKYDVRKNFADSRLRIKVSNDLFIVKLIVVIDVMLWENN